MEFKENRAQKKKDKMIFFIRKIVISVDFDKSTSGVIKMLFFELFT